MATVRIYKVAELLNTSSQEVIALLKRDHGIEVKSASSTIEEVVARQFVDRLARQRNIVVPSNASFADTPAAVVKGRKPGGKPEPPKPVAPALPPPRLVKSAKPAAPPPGQEEPAAPHAAAEAVLVPPPVAEPAHIHVEHAARRGRAGRGRAGARRRTRISRSDRSRTGADRSYSRTRRRARSCNGSPRGRAAGDSRDGSSSRKASDGAAGHPAAPRHAHAHRSHRAANVAPARRRSRTGQAPPAPPRRPVLVRPPVQPPQTPAAALEISASLVQPAPAHRCLREPLQERCSVRLADCRRAPARWEGRVRCRRSLCVRLPRRRGRECLVIGRRCIIGPAASARAAAPAATSPACQSAWQRLPRRRR